MRTARLVVITLLLVALAAPAAFSASPAYPRKSIQLIVPWVPGGGSDISARVMSEGLRGILPEAIVVSNIDGAAGLNAASRVFNARPDGYTLLWEHPGNLTVAPMVTKAKFRWTDYEYVCAIGSSELVLITGKNSPWSSASEALNAVKNNPKKHRWSMALNAVTHFLFLSISEVAGGLDVVAVPSQGDKGRIIDILSGKSDLATVAWAAAEPYYKSGDVKVLGIMNTERSIFAPNIPTLKEQGYDVVGAFLYSMEAPKGTPKEVLDTLRAAFKKALELPETQERLKMQCISPKFLDGDETYAHWKMEAEHYEKLARKNNLIQ